MRAKVALIEAIAASPSRTPHQTVVTEREVNSYLAFEAGASIPVGLTVPRIHIHDERSLAATAVLDLDAVRAQRRSRGWFDPLNYLSGHLPVALSGRLHAAGGLARVELESANIAGVPIPRILVQELLSYYSRTPNDPDGLNLDDPLPLPARIREIRVRRGEAVVVQ